MAGDLGSTAAEVHAKAQEVLGFWFEGLMPEQWFAHSESVDAAIRERFETLLAQRKAACSVPPPG